MEKEQKKRRRKMFLIISLTINLGLLFIFKYFNFLNETTNNLLASLNINYPVQNFSLLLPMGISFYTFQTLSYTIDVYRGKRKAERHLGYFALYVSYFPQLVAGPIERSDRLLPQLRKKHVFNQEMAKHGLQRMLWGFFQKIVIADTISIVVDTVYNSPQEHSGLAFIIATVAFAIQILSDFAGYSNIAIGCAQIMGIELMENFKQPYFAISIRDFWARWHISLSSWFKDYVYISLGGNRVKRPRYYLNIFITFFLSGIWHGANWTFVIWGSIHGILRIIEDFFGALLKKRNIILMKNSPKIKRVVSTVIVFILICFAWIFFRANTLSDALYIVSNIFNDADNWMNPSYINMIRNDIGLDFISIFLPVVIGTILMILIWISREKGNSGFSKFNSLPLLLRWIFYIIVSLMIIFIFTKSGETAQFIYFQF